jgi:hypothetical protein
MSPLLLVVVWAEELRPGRPRLVVAAVWVVVAIIRHLRLRFLCRLRPRYTRHPRRQAPPHRLRRP